MGAIVLVGGLHLTKYRTPVAAVGAANKKYKRVNIIHPIAAWMPKAVYKQRHGGTHSLRRFNYGGLRESVFISDIKLSRYVGTAFGWLHSVAAREQPPILAQTINFLRL